MLSLVMNPGLPEEQAMSLSPGTATIGRTQDNPVVCTHKSLSRKHARLDFDGKNVRVADLQSKNGIFFKGQRVPSCTLVEGDSFRCGDVTFLLRGASSRSPQTVQTLPSPLGVERPPPTAPEAELRYQDRLLLLIGASELLVGRMPLDQVLDELVVLAVQALEADRIALLALDETTREMKPKVIKSFVGAAPRPYSKRVIDWVTEHGTPTTFADVSKDRTLPGDPHEDKQIRSAMAVPINPGGGSIGVLYADSLSRTDAFRPDDLALFRALANIAAVAMDSHVTKTSR